MRFPLYVVWHYRGYCMNQIFAMQRNLLGKIKEFEGCADRDYPLDWERIHMISCAKIGQLLALKRGVNPELAAIACSVHDYGRIVTGKQRHHAEAGYEPLKQFLLEVGSFTAEEIEMLARAAQNHSSKREIGTPLEEVVKDADVLDCYQYGILPEREEQKERLALVRKELALPER